MYNHVTDCYYKYNDLMYNKYNDKYEAIDQVIMSDIYHFPARY